MQARGQQHVRRGVSGRDCPGAAWRYARRGLCAHVVSRLPAAARAAVLRTN